MQIWAHDLVAKSPFVPHACILWALLQYRTTLQTLHFSMIASFDKYFGMLDNMMAPVSLSRPSLEHTVGFLTKKIALKEGTKVRLNIIYGAFFQACANLMQKEAEKVKIEKIIEAAFQQCCEQGQVDDLVCVEAREHHRKL